MGRVKSIYGTVHYYDTGIAKGRAYYSTVCGKQASIGGKTWMRTKDAVTCQRCLTVLKQKGWDHAKLPAKVSPFPELEIVDHARSLLDQLDQRGPIMETKEALRTALRDKERRDAILEMAGMVSATEGGTKKDFMKVDRQLRKVLTATDPFWTMWRFIGEKRGWLDKP